MEAYLDWQKKSGGIKLNDVIEDFKYVYKGKEVKAGDLVNYIEGIASKVDYGESLDTSLSTQAQTGYTISAVKLDENRVFIAHSGGSNYYLMGMVVAISGATIIKGSDTFLIDTATNTTKNQAYSISTCLLSDGRVFIAHSYGTDYHLYGMVISIEGTTIIRGKLQGLYEDSNCGYKISTVLMPSGDIFIAHSYGSSYYLYGMVVSISGTDITVKASTQLSNASSITISTCLLPNGNVFIAHPGDSTNYYLYGIVCSISGTTITKGSDTALVSSTYTGARISEVLLDNGNVFIAHSYRSSYNLYGIVCSVSGTTITKGTDTVLSNSAAHEGYRISAIKLDNGKVFIAHKYSNPSGYLYGIVCSISGTTITKGTDTQLNSTTDTGHSISSLLLDNGTIFIAHSNTTDYHLYAQIWGIDENNIPTNNIIAAEYEQQVTPAIEPPFDAVALSSGVGGTDTEHNEQVKIARVGIEVTKTGNMFGKTWTRVSATEYIASDGTILTASSSDETALGSTLCRLDYICDNDTANVWRTESGLSHWVKFKLPEAKKITKMKTQIYANANFTNAVIQGSNNDSDWIDLYTISSRQDALTEITLSNVDYYQYCRMVINQTASFSYVFEWQTSEYVEVI